MHGWFETILISDVLGVISHKTISEVAITVNTNMLSALLNKYI